jgi:hypothetical protein
MTAEYPDPTATFLHIYKRLQECQARGEKMPTAEASQSFTLLMHACSQLIAQNERLRLAVALSDQIVEELEIELCIKDLEIFNFTSQTDPKDSKDE